MARVRVLNTFTLSMISISAILSMREFPLMASIGLQAIFFYVVGAVMFLLPSAFVCAELASAMPNGNGLYDWVRAGFGKRVAFLAMWMEWINNVISAPATLVTIVATAAYVGAPPLGRNPIFLFVLMMVVYWGLTFFNFTGMRTSSRLNVIGAIFGTLLPSVLMIVLGVLWMLFGHPLVFNTHTEYFLPTWDYHSMAFLVGVLSGYAGMQITGFHAHNVSDPAHTFPCAIFSSTVIIFIVSLLASLAIAVVVPSSQISYVSGMIGGFSQFLTHFHMAWLTPVIALCIVLGALASMSAWILGPARGVQEMAADRMMPRYLAKTNKNDMPVAVLLTQGVIGTALASLFLFMPTVKSAFWVLLTLTSQLTVLMYVLLFTAALRLRYTHPEMKRPYRIPGGLPFMWSLIVMAVTACSISFAFSMFPPTEIHITHESLYVLGLLACDALILFIPMVLLVWSRRHHHK